MPESKGRDKKPAYTPPPTRGERKTAKLGSPSWLAPTMVALFVIGLAWIVVYYIAGATLPVMKDIGWWNVIIGFGLIFVGFGMSTRWR